MSWKEEYERRLRRVVGQTDDSVDVFVEMCAERGYSDGCDTCGYGADPDTVQISVTAGHKYYREFSGEDAFGQLMIALLEVEDN